MSCIGSINASSACLASLAVCLPIYDLHMLCCSALPTHPWTKCVSSLWFLVLGGGFNQGPKDTVARWVVTCSGQSMTPAWGQVKNGRDSSLVTYLLSLIDSLAHESGRV